MWRRFVTGEIYEHLWVTLIETRLAFLIGSVFGVVVGLWLALAPAASAIFDPYIKAINAMPRVILAPVFFVWFGLDIASKVALGVTLVFFIVFFNLYQGVKEVSPVVLANARMLGRHPVAHGLRADARLGRGNRGKAVDGVAAARKRHGTHVKPWCCGAKKFDSSSTQPL